MLRKTSDKTPAIDSCRCAESRCSSRYAPIGEPTTCKNTTLLICRCCTFVSLSSLSDRNHINVGRSCLWMYCEAVCVEMLLHQTSNHMHYGKQCSDMVTFAYRQTVLLCSETKGD